VGHSDRPTRHCRREPGPLSFEIDDVVDRSNGEKVLLCELPFGVVDNAERGSMPRNGRAGAHVLKPRMWGAVVHSPADKRVRLENVIRLRRAQKSPRFVKSVGPSKVELLQVVVVTLEFPTV
jgi:hypothetical protein